MSRKKISLTNDFEQAGEHYRSLSKVDQDHLVDNIAASLGKTKKDIQKRMVKNLTKADAELGKRSSRDETKIDEEGSMQAAPLPRLQLEYREAKKLGNVYYSGEKGRGNPIAGNRN